MAPGLIGPKPHVLREYALLADGERGVLVGPRGDFAWMCFPRWHDDAVFSSLIGGGGEYAVRPLGRYVWGGYYEPGSLIWHSRWVTDNGAVIECREALALPSFVDRAIIPRRIVAVRGCARVHISFGPRGAFGETEPADLRRRDDGSWSGRLGPVRFRWLGGADATPRGNGARGEQLELLLELDEGEQHDLVLALGPDEEALDMPPAEVAWSSTEAAWRARVPALEHAAGRRDARHAYAVLTGLTSSDGGMVAAATTALPERAHEGRNYDYRYAWIRDQCIAGEAVAAAGAFPLLDDSVRFVTKRLLEDGSNLKPAYRVDGGAVPGERRLGLPGYPGGSDRVGNHARDQFQLDAFGEALLLFAAAANHDRLDHESCRAADIAADAVARRWCERDCGIWETKPDEWTHSRLICAAGLRAFGESRSSEPKTRLLDLAGEITAHVGAHAVHPSGRWQRSPGDERIDAALLLVALRGAIPADDPRTLATLRAVEQELTEDGYAYRYRPDSRPLGEAEGAFLLCGFIMSLAFAHQGNHVGAMRWFERNRAACGPPGLLSEEFDVGQRQLRGNLPQTFVHALLLECAVTLQRQA